ncbi:MAG: NFACT RNA binding domain-containing protein [Chloroflexota bacterium]
MYFDAMTMSALVDEFMDELVGGRVQNTIDVDPTGYGLEIYNNQRRNYLYMSADQQAPRVHRVGDTLRRGMYKPRQMGLLLRRYIRGAILMHVSQPKWERILFLDFEHPEHGEIRIIIEPMPRRANVLLVRNDIILDCVHRVSAEDNRYRQSLPNYEYQMPPPLTDRVDPFALTLEDVEGILDSTDKPHKNKLERILPRRMFGFSPLMGREIAYRAVGDTSATLDAFHADELFFVMQDFAESLKKRDWQPGVGTIDGVVEAFSVYPLTYTDDWQKTANTSTAVTDYYGAAVGEEAYEQAKKPVREAIEEAKIKYSKKLEGLENSLRDDAELEKLQHSGELILAHQYQMDEGQVQLVAQYMPDDPPLEIKLDPTLTPLENAQKYFDKYKRAKRARANVPQLITEAKQDLDYILQLESDIENAVNWLEIDDVIQSLQNQGFDVLNKKVKRLGGGERSAPLRLTKDGYIIWVGRNSRQNDEVTFRKANSDDLWLHARDVPGSHVVIRNDGRRIPDELIESAAAIAAYYSPKRDEKRADVIITRCKYVKPIKNAGPGMVIFRKERTLTVVPQNEEILQDD